VASSQSTSGALVIPDPSARTPKATIRTSSILNLKIRARVPDSTACASRVRGPPRAPAPRLCGADSIPRLALALFSTFRPVHKFRGVADLCRSVSLIRGHPRSPVQTRPGVKDTESLKSEYADRHYWFHDANAC